MATITINAEAPTLSERWAVEDKTPIFDEAAFGEKLRKYLEEEFCDYGPDELIPVKEIRAAIKNVIDQELDARPEIKDLAGFLATADKFILTSGGGRVIVIFQDEKGNVIGGVHTEGNIETFWDTPQGIVFKEMTKIFQWNN